MTEPDNTPVPDTQVTPETPDEQTDTAVTPDSSGDQPGAAETTPVEVAPEETELNAAPVSGAVSDPSAVSDVDSVNPDHAEDDDPESLVGDEVEEG